MTEPLRYYIWSNEHNAWWRANHSGYADRVCSAGLYSYEEAINICNKANYGWTIHNTSKIPNELPIAENIAGRLVGEVGICD